MAHPICLISSDISSIRVFSDAGESLWNALQIPDEEAERPGPWMMRVREAARWINSQPTVRRRLASVCIDVDQMVCTWLRAPAATNHALNAAWREVSQEWGAASQGWTVQPLTISSKKAKSSRKIPFVRQSKSVDDLEQGVRGPVVVAPDALVRLWLDALDRQGVRCDVVQSLWHAMAAVWSEESNPGGNQLGATIAATNDERLIWCWHRGRNLVCGGSTSLSRAVESQAPEPDDTIDLDQAVQRLTMDWLAWTAHLGEAPQIISIVGLRADQLAERWRDRWPDADFRARDEEDVIAATLTRLAADRSMIAGASDDGARSLLHPTNRPNRAVRIRYHAAAAMLALVAVAIGGMGWRVRQASEDHLMEAAQLREQTVALVEALGDPALAGPNPKRALESKIVEEMNKPRIQLPREPLPVYEELQRAVETIARFQDVDLTQITIDDGTSGSLQLNVPTRQVAVELQVALQSGGKLNWEPSRSTPGTEQRIQFTGRWNR